MIFFGLISKLFFFGFSLLLISFLFCPALFDSIFILLLFCDCILNFFLANIFSYLFIKDDFNNGKVSAFSLNLSSSKINCKDVKYVFLKFSFNWLEFEYLG